MSKQPVISYSGASQEIWSHAVQLSAVQGYVKDGVLQVMFILIPPGYGNFAAIEIFDLETVVQDFNGNMTIIPRRVHKNIGC